MSAGLAPDARCAGRISGEEAEVAENLEGGRDVSGWPGACCRRNERDRSSRGPASANRPDRRCIRPTNSSVCASARGASTPCASRIRRASARSFSPRRSASGESGRAPPSRGCPPRCVVGPRSAPDLERTRVQCECVVELASIQSNQSRGCAWRAWSRHGRARARLPRRAWRARPSSVPQLFRPCRS